MFISEVNFFLNRICAISFTDSDKLLTLSAKYGFSGIAKFRMNGKSGFSITNIPKSQPIPAEALKGFAELGLMESDTAFKGKWDVADEATLSMFRNLLSVPSVVIDSVLITKGRRTIIFRFHDTDLQKISSLLTAPTKLRNFSINFLMENKDKKYFINYIPSSTVLKYYELVTSVPPSSMNLVGDYVIATFGNNWYREVKYLLEDEIHAVYYEKSSLIARSGQLKDISTSEKIYEMSFQNPMITHVFSETTKKMVSILGMQQRMVGKNFLMGMIIPEAVESEFQEILGDLAVKFKDWKPIVSSVSRLEEAISG
ncbi:MAG: hypothetical protein AAE986_01515 [Thermoplasmataceae archaeon]|jgi:hypothetical protein|nr:hypothetical protein [Candidatus Thermoplasmatota archaeon]